MMFPKLVVFDLDFTLWDCGGTWCDCLRPPFSKRDGLVCDAFGRDIRLYSDVIPLMDDIDELGLPMALASRTDRPDWARELLTLLEVEERFKYQEIYPGSKVTHMQNLSEASGVPLESILFFDDEQRNLNDLKPLGVNCVLVENGMTDELFSNGLEIFV